MKFVFNSCACCQYKVTIEGFAVHNTDYTFTVTNFHDAINVVILNERLGEKSTKANRMQRENIVTNTYR